MKPFKSLKIIKKTRSKKICRGCNKSIPVGSECISLFEFLEIRYQTAYFHNVDCVKKAISEFFHNIAEDEKFIQNYINKMPHQIK